MRRRSPGASTRVVALPAAVAAILLLAGCGGDNGADSARTGAGIETFGKEANAKDSDEAGRAVAEFLRARANGNAAKACSLMAASAKQNLAEFGGQPLNRARPRCTELVEALRSQIQAKALAREERIEVTGVRVEGERGFVLFRDAGGKESALAIVRERFGWKVGGIAGYPLP
jgi:hypothetical protein